MRLLSSITIVFSLCVLLVATSASSLDRQFKNGLNYFSRNIFHEILKTHGRENIIFSPFSTQTCLAMLRMGADSKTARELDHVLGFSSIRAENVADKYFSLLVKYDGSSVLSVANKIYVMQDYQLKDTYNDFLAENFLASAESIDFHESARAADIINHWVESQTNHVIKDIISPTLLDAHTKIVLVNTVYFKGEWAKPFISSLTKENDFYIDETNTVKVQMMRIPQDTFAWEFYLSLNAEAVRMPYKDSDLSMVIILPSSRTGLPDLMEKLKDIKLSALTNRMFMSKICITMPKFKVEMGIELTNTLQELGLKNIFASGSFGRMIETPEPLQVSAVVHKAFIQVDELGSEAGAATAKELRDRSYPTFVTVDHPFYYAIVNSDDVVLFQGTVVNF